MPNWLLLHHVFHRSPLSYTAWTLFWKSPFTLPFSLSLLLIFSAVCIFLFSSPITSYLVGSNNSLFLHDHASQCGLIEHWVFSSNGYSMIARICHYPQKGNSSSFRLFRIFALLKDKVSHSLTFPGAKLIQLDWACLSLAWSCTSVSQHCRTGHTVLKKSLSGQRFCVDNTVIKPT